uniref:THAP domain-containing protein 5 n=1 Tax=Pelusios castaneus TaxID=367368 RepID=A0A8C8VI33_9SAUR
MKRDTWTPSKHQVLCSDHFTPDSLDVRWGIRYLKHTAIPTIFSLPDDQEKDLSQHKPQEIKIENGEEINVCAESDSLSASLEPCTPKESVITTGSLDEKAEAICLSTLSNPLQKKVQLQNTEDLQAGTIILSSSEQHVQQSPVLMAGPVQNIETSNVHTSVENLLSCTATVLQVTNPEYLDSSLKFNHAGGPVIHHPAENSNSHIASCSVEVQPSENAVFFSTITRTIEEFNGNEESVIAIFVPAEYSKEPSMISSSFIPIKQEFIDMEEIEAEKSAYINNCGETEVLQTEHSYCRQDIDRDHLWQKIAKLHSKIILLEKQERKTLGRLKSLEALIGQLKQENLLSEEKLKIVENCFTTFEVTMIQ